MKFYDLGKLNILVLEKHLLIRRLLTEVFEEFGVASVFSTAEPAQAYEYFRKFSPDLVLCDWTPDLNGMAFLSRVRKSKDSPNPFASVIVATASTELRHVIAARDMGMTEFLAKPISAEALYRRICMVIEDKRPFVKNKQFFGPDRRRRQMAISGVDRRKAKQRVSRRRPS